MNYEPKRRKWAARTPFSFEDGDFNANVDGGQQLGALHVALGLPIDPFVHESNIKYYDGEGPERAPFFATAKETRAWAKTVTRGLRFIEDDDDYLTFFTAWRDFLATCSGYRVRS